MDTNQHRKLAEHYKKRHAIMAKDQGINGGYKGYRAIDYFSMYEKYLQHKRIYTTQSIVQTLNEHIITVSSISIEIKQSEYIRVLKMVKSYAENNGYNKIPEMIETWRNRFENTPMDLQYKWDAFKEVFDFVEKSHSAIYPLW